MTVMAHPVEDILLNPGIPLQIYTSPQLAAVSALVVPAMAGMAIVYGRYVRRITKTELDKYAEIMKYAEERFGNVKTVKTFCREQQEVAAFDGLLDEALQIGYKETRARSIFFGLVSEILFKLYTSLKSSFSRLASVATSSLYPCCGMAAPWFCKTL